MVRSDSLRNPPDRTPFEPLSPGSAKNRDADVSDVEASFPHHCSESQRKGRSEKLKLSHCTETVEHHETPAILGHNEAFPVEDFPTCLSERSERCGPSTPSDHAHGYCIIPAICPRVNSFICPGGTCVCSLLHVQRESTITRFL